MSDIEKTWQKKRAIFDNLFRFLELRIDLYADFTVLEFGVGKWGFAGFYNDIFEKVYGLDIEDYSTFHPGVDFILYDGESRIPMADSSVDMVVSHSVLEHVTDLDFSLTEINRITKKDGLFFLTVDPLYYSAFGSHIYKDSKRMDNWEHLIEGAEFYLTDNPAPEVKTSGHFLNKLTSEKFLSAVSKQPWNIEQYWLDFERKEINKKVSKNNFKELDLVTKGFRFIGRKVKDYNH